MVPGVGTGMFAAAPGLRPVTVAGLPFVPPGIAVVAGTAAGFAVAWSAATLAAGDGVAASEVGLPLLPPPQAAANTQSRSARANDLMVLSFRSRFAGQTRRRRRPRRQRNSVRHARTIRRRGCPWHPRPQPPGTDRRTRT